jgi:GT2 family glycosyltransferase
MVDDFSALPADETQVDVLVVTFNRPDYTRKTLDRLIEATADRARLWIWHNGTDEETLAIARGAAERAPHSVFNHQPENSHLRVPINWVFAEGTAPYVAKVDDDCLVPDGWLETSVAAIAANADLGAVAGWHFPEEDFDPELAAHKIRDLDGGYRLMQNPWVQGSGFVIERAVLDQHGLIADDETWTDYARQLAREGYRNGWLLPLMLIDHMDDPRSPNTGLRTDADIVATAPLSAQHNGVTTIEAWQAQLQNSARIVQRYPAEERGLRFRLKSVSWRITGAIRRVVKGSSW